MPPTRPHLRIALTALLSQFLAFVVLRTQGMAARPEEGSPKDSLKLAEERILDLKHLHLSPEEESKALERLLEDLKKEKAQLAQRREEHRKKVQAELLRAQETVRTESVKAKALLLRYGHTEALAQKIANVVRLYHAIANHDFWARPRFVSVGMCLRQ